MQYDAVISGNYTDHVTDHNFIIVDVGVNVYTPGEYSLTGSLYDINNKEAAWSVDHKNFSIGSHIMHLNFDNNFDRNIIEGPLHLSNLKLTLGSSDSGLVLCDFLPMLYYPIACNLTNSISHTSGERQLTGVGYGELLLKFTIQYTAPVISSSYSYDIVGINIPPISTSFSVSPSKKGYAYNLSGIYMPNKPNNFTVSATGVKNLNIGLKKSQGSYENSSNVWENKRTRIWITSQVIADENGAAIARSDLLSPGRYQVKIFGDAVNNVTRVNLMMSVVKKIIVNGPFNLSINTTGLPSGNCSINVKALNGSINLNELAIRCRSIAN